MVQFCCGRSTHASVDTNHSVYDWLHPFMITVFKTSLKLQNSLCFTHAATLSYMLPLCIRITLECNFVPNNFLVTVNCYISSNSPAGCSAELASGPGRWSREGTIQVGRLSHLDPPAGHNPVLQWSWPSPSLWLVQGGRRQYAGGAIIQATDFSLCKVVLVIIASYVYACSWHDFRITAVLMPARVKICLELHVAVSDFKHAVWKYLHG